VPATPRIPTGLAQRQARISAPAGASTCLGTADQQGDPGDFLSIDNPCGPNDRSTDHWQRVGGERSQLLINVRTVGIEK